MDNGIFASTSLGLGAYHGLGSTGSMGALGFPYYDSVLCVGCRASGAEAADNPACWACPDAPEDGSVAQPTQPGGGTSTTTPSTPKPASGGGGGGGGGYVPPMTMPGDMSAGAGTGISLGGALSSPLVLAAGVALLGVGAVILYGRSKRQRK